MKNKKLQIFNCIVLILTIILDVILKVYSKRYIIYYDIFLITNLLITIFVILKKQENFSKIIIRICSMIQILLSGGIIVLSWIEGVIFFQGIGISSNIDFAGLFVYFTILMLTVTGIMNFMFTIKNKKLSKRIIIISIIITVVVFMVPIIQKIHNEYKEMGEDTGYILEISNGKNKRKYYISEGDKINSSLQKNVEYNVGEIIDINIGEILDKVLDTTVVQIIKINADDIKIIIDTNKGEKNIKLPYDYLYTFIGNTYTSTIGNTYTPTNNEYTIKVIKK